MNYRFKAWVSRAGKSLIFVQVSLDWLSMEVFHLMGQVLLRTPLLAPHRFLSLLERGAEILERDFPSCRLLVCSLHIILFKQHHQHNPRLQGTFDSFDQPSLISKLAVVWKNRPEHRGLEHLPLSSPQGGGSTMRWFRVKAWSWTSWFKFQPCHLLAGKTLSKFLHWQNKHKRSLDRTI